jgi:hypothetical protein
VSVAITALLIANTINVAADLAGMDLSNINPVRHSTGLQSSTKPGGLCLKSDLFQLP